MIAEELKKLIGEAIEKAGLLARLPEGGPAVNFTLEHPTELAHGDYATNAALIIAKKVNQNPKEVAAKIVEQITPLGSPTSKWVQKVEVAGAGFINFYLTPEFFAEQVGEIIKAGDEFGKNTTLAGQKIIIEHTQPNPFKEFHIGHMMNNTIGEALARIIKANGAEVKTASYHGDVGLHVAKAVLTLNELPQGSLPKDNADLKEKVMFLGSAYAMGSDSYESSDVWKQKILSLNKKIYDRSDDNINKLYDWGREVSLKYFDSLYTKLGSKFDFDFFESQSGSIGKELVLANMGEIFKDSEGAVIYEGEKVGLHTRVFLTKEKLPTYEAKELGLAKIKKELFAFDLSLTVTDNGQDDFFKVVEVATSEVFPELDGKLEHISHGMLRLPSGKMSSRTGDVITAEDMIAEVIKRLPEPPASPSQGGIEEVAIGAIKFSILKQAIGKDIVFDIDKSISFEGDSGPYLQYTYVRTKSILEKTKELGIKGDTLGIQKGVALAEVSVVEKLVYRLPEVIEKAGREYAPQQIITYLLELTSAYNNFYATNKIVDPADPASPYRVALTCAVNQALKNGLTVLGISVPERM